MLNCVSVQYGTASHNSNNILKSLPWWLSSICETLEYNIYNFKGNWSSMGSIWSHVNYQDKNELIWKHFLACDGSKYFRVQTN